MYLQSLKPLAVGVHEPRPLWGTRTWSVAPSPAGTLPSRSRTLATLPTGGVPAQEGSPGHPYLAASSSPPQSQTGGQIRGHCVEKNTSHESPQTSASSIHYRAQRKRFPNWPSVLGSIAGPQSSGRLGNPRSRTWDVVWGWGRGEGWRVPSAWQPPGRPWVSASLAQHTPQRATQRESQ